MLYILRKRQKNGKEHPARLSERQGIPSINRPSGSLIWLHAASVGEAQSALVIINTLTKRFKHIKVMVTTGTLTSAALMEKRLPNNAFHQFYPLDHPKWVKRFLQHWKPSAVLWMESELWPNMLHEIKEDNIPAILINARLSEKSFSTWRKLGSLSKKVLSTFDIILAQTQNDQAHFLALGAKQVLSLGNIKHSAHILESDHNLLNSLKASINGRPVWLYASTHDGEEQIACNIHKRLKNTFPNILTIIVPRHPKRRTEIQVTCENASLNTTFRGSNATLPQDSDDIYIADTLGELGLFYSLTPIACIGRSLSNDGGGGHNPIEAAQLGCVVLHGPNVQNLQDIYNDMHSYKAAVQVNTDECLYEALIEYLSNSTQMKQAQQKALEYSTRNHDIVDNVMVEVIDFFNTNKVVS